jgi:hypothetical protein
MEQVELLLSASPTSLDLHAQQNTTLCKCNGEGRCVHATADVLVHYTVNWTIMQTHEWSPLYALSKERKSTNVTIYVRIAYDVVPR